MCLLLSTERLCLDAATKEAHIKDIEQKYKSAPVPETKKEVIQPAIGNSVQNEDTKAEEKLCPRCGEKLVVRVAKRGNNAGKSFYGCSAFPKCKYTQEI